MLTEHTRIVYALPPKRSSKKKARVEHPNLPTVTQARALSMPRSSPLDAVDPVKAGEAVDRLWQTLVREPNN
jgi:hypothetical protein